MKDLVLFISGVFAGSAAIFGLVCGWSPWPAEKRRGPSPGHKSSDSSWLR